jgi:tetratricopeptide (TPR) repeat protein
MATRQAQGTAESDLTVPVLLHPASGERLLDPPRQFRWMSVQGVPLYRVSLYNTSEMMWQSTISDTKAACPPRTCDFRPGETYYWVVEALVGNTTLRSEAADFRVLDRDSRAVLYKALEETDATVADVGMASLLKARLCADARVFSKALEILDGHLRQSPDRSAYLLRAELGEIMGLKENAISDYKRATALPPAE